MEKTKVQNSKFKAQCSMFKIQSSKLKETEIAPVG
jgi:hypothetical protein